MLKFIKATDVDLIPRRLIEHIEGRRYTVDEFYRVKRLYISSLSIDLIVNEENAIIGFLEYSLDELNKEIYINTLSIDREYQCDGRTLDFVINTFKLLSKKLNYNVLWHCYRPSYFLRHGFTAVKGSLLHYTCV